MKFCCLKPGDEERLLPFDHVDHHGHVLNGIIPPDFPAKLVLQAVMNLTCRNTVNHVTLVPTTTR